MDKTMDNQEVVLGEAVEFLHVVVEFLPVVVEHVVQQVLDDSEQLRLRMSRSLLMMAMDSWVVVFRVGE